MCVGKQSILLNCRLNFFLCTYVLCASVQHLQVSSLIFLLSRATYIIIDICFVFFSQELERDLKLQNVSLKLLLSLVIFVSFLLSMLHAFLKNWVRHFKPRIFVHVDF